MPQIIAESVSLATAPAAKSGRIRIKIIDAGQGSSGNYPASTIEAAVKDKVFAKGLHMYADHPGITENFDRPERTIKDLAAVLETDAEWVAEESAAYAEAKVFPHWREVISEMSEDIGVSIRASAEVEDGKSGRTITKLIHAESVDFVTKAGRGGRIAEVLESARATEATANDTREWLQAAIKNTSDGYSYVRDFDDANVWYASWADDAERLFQQGYTLNGNTATLTGDPIEVRVETSYVPVAQASEAATGNVSEAIDLPQVGDRVVIDPERLHDPAHNTGTIAEIGTTAYGLVMDGMPEMGVHRWYTADEFDYEDDAAMSMEAKKRRKKKKRPMPGMPGMEALADSPPVPAGVTENQGEATMATIDDKELAALRESASRATTAEAEITTATTRATRAEAGLTEANDAAAAAVVEAAFNAAGLSAPKTAARLSKGYPLKENGVLDAEALAIDVAESIAELQAANGAGTVRGLGDTVTEAKTITDDDVVNAL